MNWLPDNPFGRALVYVCGGLLLLVIIMTIVWSLPVSVDTAERELNEGEVSETIVAAREIDSMNKLQIINQKPLFNENRLPEIVGIGDSAVIEDTAVTVKGAPDVRLTGVIITPEIKIATLTPSGADLENVMAHEGESLVGEYVGWKVGEVKPRTVVLTSSDGQQLRLELQVHDMTIKEPPKRVGPVAAVQNATAQAAAQGGSGQGGSGQPPPRVGEDGRPLSRAEQIRRRIAERRDELRLEQEARAEQTKDSEQARSDQTVPSNRSAYQNAIRNMMNKKKDNDSNDKSDG